MTGEISKFIDKFTEKFSMYSFGNPGYGQLCAHVLLGQVLKDCQIPFGPLYIDPRVSIFIIQPSATGKSTAWDLIAKVAREGQISVDDIDEITDAALVGTIEDQEEIDPETGAKKKVYTAIKGKLATAELLHFDEGSMLFDRSSHSAHGMTWFQKALNPMKSEQSRCTKKLAHGEEITFFPTCSLIITSHPLEGVLQTILNKGFFQRIILYPRDIPINERQIIEYQRADKLGKSSNVEVDILSLGKSLQEIRKLYNGKPIEFSSKIKPVIKAKIKTFYTLIEQSHPKVKEIVATFIPRYNNYMYILALHHVCDRGGSMVKIEDINYAFKIIYVIFRELINWVEETADFYKIGNKDKSYLMLAKNLYYRTKKDTNDGWVMKRRFINICAEKWKISKHTIRKYLERFKGYGKLKEYEKDNITYIKMES